MSWGVNQVERIFLAIENVVHLYGVAFNGDASLALQLHIVEHLCLKVFTFYCFGYFEQTVGQRAFAVVDVCYNAKITNVFHIAKVEKIIVNNCKE